MERRQGDHAPAAAGEETRVSDAPGRLLLGTDAETSAGRPFAPGASGEATAADGGAPHGSEPPVIAIPGYELVREIHRGGQGVVYLAVQLSTRQRVAIKVLREGPFASAVDRARFEREVHVLAQLQHPNIVSIIDSGTAGGHSYLVMDYIAGEPLDEYVRGHPRTLRQTLTLFATICDAVHAAHVRGVIHRDLKPSNIRVDHDGLPHVLDFGLAKTSEAEVDLTVTGRFMGSLPWASPEQAEAVPGKVDTRSDVYALGVILYQLLTGRFPYEVSGTMRDVLDRIMRAEPMRPSRAGSVLSGQPAAGRHTSVSGRLKRMAIDNEVETIVLKCLQKERERRYQNAGELARDVRYYLAGEAIDAKRDSTPYVLAKLLRRHRTAALGSAGLLVLLVAFAIAMSVAYAQVAHARQRTEAVAGFLEGVLVMVDPEQQDALEAGQPYVTDTPLHAALRDTVARAERDVARFSGQVDVQARVRLVLGRTYINLGLYPQAAEILEQALAGRRQLHGDQHPETAEALHYLAWARKEQGRAAEAQPLYEQALAIRRQTLGDAAPAVTDTLNGLGQLAYEQREFTRAEPLLREALARRQRSGDARGLATSLANLGSLLRDSGRLDEAEPLLRQALELRRTELGEQHFATLVSSNKLGLLLLQRGQRDEARALFAAVLAARRAQLGNNHPLVAVSLNNLALAEFEAGEYSAAAPRFTDAARILQQQSPPNAPRVAFILSNAAAALLELQEYESAGTALADAERILRADPAAWERAQPVAGRVLALQGRLALAAGDLVAAEPRLRAALAQLGTTTAEPRLYAITESMLGEVLARLGQPAEASTFLADGHARLQALRGDEDPETQRAAARLHALSAAPGDPR